MEFLDKHPGKSFTAKEIYCCLGGKITQATIYRALVKIRKREEYAVDLIFTKKDYTAHYRRV